MRNQFFDPSFLFDFYSDRGSTATPSARSSELVWTWNIFGQKRRGVVFEVFPTLIAHGIKTRRARVLIIWL